MVKFSDLLFDKSLHGLDTDWRDVIRRRFDFHDVIYHIQPCNVDDTRRNVVFTTSGRSKTYIEIRVPFKTTVTRISNTLFKMAESL